MSDRFIGIDWGTTHRRATLLDAQGRVLAQQSDAEGTLACAGRFKESLAALLRGWPQADASVPVVMSGMVGAAIGWQEVPYLDAATPLAQLGRQLVPVRDAPPGRACFIVPGCRWQGADGEVDVMRGEEVQLLGALQLLGPGASDGLYVLPGTHSKWVELRDGRVRWLRTYMTGELFALLREKGTLAAMMQAGEAGADGPMFARGVADVGRFALSHSLFGARARVVTGALSPVAASAYVSGLLIGAEWKDLAQLPERPAAPIRLIGDPRLAAHHAACARQLGEPVQVLDVEAVQLAAWQALREQGERR
jgi:2-dehydro-3-deoxygalactonokinase